MPIISHSESHSPLPIYALRHPDFITSDSEPLNAGEELEELPGYSPRVTAAVNTGEGSTMGPRRTVRLPAKEFGYQVARRGQDIVKLILLANARVSKDSPTFIGSEPIAGTVRLKLDKPTAVKAITVTICGRCLPTVGYYVDTNSYSDETTFMEISHTIWSSEHNSRAPDMISGGLTLDGKLQGEYLWSFSVDLPSTLVAPISSGDIHFVPPQTFKEQFCAMVVYDILLRIKRTWPNTDYKIEAPFHYIPAIFPSEFPLLRRLAYEDGSPLSPPGDNPEEWHALRTVQLTGTLFKSRPLDIECTLFLANPLQYTRGAEIPLFMRLTSHSTQALDLMCTGAAQIINVRLKWRITLSALKKSRDKLSTIALVNGDRVKDGTSTKAVWWPPTNTANETAHDGQYSRYIRGELRLKNGLKPSSAMPYMKIEYFVSLLPFSSVTGIELDEDNDKIHQTQFVEIGTMYGPGPVPKRYVPT